MRTYNLFISHSWSYSDSYEKLEHLLREKSYFEFKDYSVPKDDPIHTKGSDQELRQAIMDKMRFCNAILILAGVYASYSKWIQKEILMAKNEFSPTKPIIAIEPWMSEKTSQFVKERADLVVGWNANSIVGAIRELT